MKNGDFSAFIRMKCVSGSDNQQKEKNQEREIKTIAKHV